LYLCLPFSQPVIRWFINCKLSGSLSAFVDLAKKEGLEGLWNLWPTPSSEAWAILAVFGAAEAVLQLYLPGKTFYGPISPKGNIPVYKVAPTMQFLLPPKNFTSAFSSGHL
jgi:7-dehydrocholesterol reductase